MRKPLVALSLLAAIFCLPDAASAKWVQEEIKWQISSVGTPTDPTGIYVRDTLYNVLAAGQTDTTNEFSLNKATAMPRGVTGPGTGVNLIGATGSDTTVIGWIIACPDSNVAGTSTLSSLTMFVDGKAGGFGATTALSMGWVKQDSALVSSAGANGLTLHIVGNETVTIPIRTVSPYGFTQRYDQLRARLVTNTGLISGRIRVFIRYWVPDLFTDR